jgi:hypothetical protein
MPRPPRTCWIVAGAAAVLLAHPSPAGLSARGPVQFDERPAPPPPASDIAALGPWSVDRLLMPYPGLPDAASAPRFVLPAATEARWLPQPVASALGPWRVEQLACPYSVTPPAGTALSARNPVANPPAPRPAPVGETVSPLGPWPVERALVPYPSTVAPRTRAAYGRTLRRVSASVQRLLYLVDDGARAVSQVLRELARPEPSSLDALAPVHEPALTDDQGSFLLPWLDAPLTASAPPAREGRWTDAASGLVVAPVPLVATDDGAPALAVLDRLFPPSTGIAFLAALLLIPTSCSITAAVVRRHARAGPRGP